MIARDLETASVAAGEIDPLVDVTALGPEIVRLCTGLLATVRDPLFPGALVPHLDGGELSVLVAAPTLTTWRRLRPVIRAFAGPTLTSFDGLPLPLPASARAAAVMLGSQPAATAVIRLPTDTRSRTSALRALARVQDTFARAPDLQRSAPEPTSWLLARFQDHLNVGRRDAAADVLARLRTELRLDALNIKFLEVQLLAAFEDWISIVELPGFASLCFARRTPATTALILEALYQVHLAGPYEAADRHETRARFEGSVRPLAHAMLALLPPSMLTVPGLRLFGLEAWVDLSRGDLRVALRDKRDELEWLTEQLSRAEHVAPVSPKDQDQPLDAARAALAQVDAVEAVDSLSAALAALARLGPDELARLRAAEPFKTALLVTEQATEGGLPTSWLEWLTLAADPAFTSALDHARRGKDEWPIGPSASDPVAVQALVAALGQAVGDGLAAERIAQALPFLVAWLRRDQDFPRAGMAPLYSNLLTLFALGGGRGRAAYESSGILINALLSTGLDADDYRSLIADVNELAADGFGVGTTYWMLEVIEDFIRAPAADSEARQDFLHRALARMAPIYGRLNSLQRAAISRLAGELGWTLQSVGVRASTETSDDLGVRMARLRIGIYSLTETSSRQAKAAIEEVTPTTVVDCNADHAGTPRLRALAENADLFVMAWLSAKHAATDFIREHRGNRPLLYAQGRGFSSILRAIDEHLASCS